MSKRTAEWVSANMARIAKAQAARAPKTRRQTIRPSEQVRRFLNGDERWRLEQGLVTPTQWADYERAMLEELGAIGGDDGRP